MFTKPYQLIKAPNNLADTVTSVLELAYRQWQKGISSSWVEVLPFYGQNPVS